MVVMAGCHHRAATITWYVTAFLCMCDCSIAHWAGVATQIVLIYSEALLVILKAFAFKIHKAQCFTCYAEVCVSFVKTTKLQQSGS